jgi:rubrerythrin
VTIDERQLTELVTESKDLQVDAMRDVKSTLDPLTEIGRERQDRRRRFGVDRTIVQRFDDDRRKVLRNGGMGMGALAARGLLGTGFGAAILGIVNSPASAQSGGDVDVQILQTAASLENLAVATYEAALGLPFIANGNETVKAFAMTTMDQHAEHGDAFNAQAVALGGEEQTEPNPVYAQAVEDAMPGLTDAVAVVELAMTLEEVATDTYLADLALLSDTDTRSLVGSVMGVEAQHLAVLRAVNALLAGDAADLITIPTDVAALPAAAGSVAFPNAMEEPDMASPPEEGAVS